MMPTSQNGYTAFTTPRTTGELPRLRKWVIPGANRTLLIRDGSIGFLLVHFALWWHETVGRLDLDPTWDEWGWAYRPIAGSSTLSNHSSGTAEDLDATRHPLGVPILRTFKVWQIAKIRLRIRLYAGCLAWGGEWSRPDGMHIEVVKDLTSCEARARALLTTPRGRRILAANPGAKEVIES